MGTATEILEDEIFANFNVRAVWGCDTRTGRVELSNKDQGEDSVVISLTKEIDNQEDLLDVFGVICEGFESVSTLGYYLEVTNLA